MTLGTRLRELRLTHSQFRSLTKFAAEVKKSASWVTKVERDEEKPSYESLRHIASLLGGDWDELLYLWGRIEPEVQQQLNQRARELTGLLRAIVKMSPEAVQSLTAKIAAEEQQLSLPGFDPSETAEHETREPSP